MKRPTFLTVWLVLLSIGAAFSILGSLSLLGLPSVPGVSEALGVIPSWYGPLLLVLSMIQVAAVVLLWRWKMLGFYLMVGGTGVSTATSYLVSGPASLLGIVFGIAAVVILYFAMKPVWGNFK